MERKRQIALMIRKDWALWKEKQKDWPLGGFFHAHKAGLGFVTLNEEEDDLFVGHDVNHAMVWRYGGSSYYPRWQTGSGNISWGKGIDILGAQSDFSSWPAGSGWGKARTQAISRSKIRKSTSRFVIKKPAMLLDGTEAPRSLLTNIQPRNTISLWPVWSMWLVMLTTWHWCIGSESTGHCLREFPEKVLEEAERVPRCTDSDLEGRLVMRLEKITPSMEC